MAENQIHTNHLGYHCGAEKTAVISNPTATHFQVENLSFNESTDVAGREIFRIVYEGKIRRKNYPLGTYGLCDFSSLQKPGIYRLSLKTDSKALSYQFIIADGVYHSLPALFLNYMNQLRSGPHATALRGPSHLDDAILSDSGQTIDAIGGWYDAGDTRKWMTHSTLPAWGLLEVADRLGGTTGIEHAAFCDESIWGLGIVPKMQDPVSGMIYEDVGGGGGIRKKNGMSWWYENLAGCYADNTDNRFTDNRPDSGDERKVRNQYNPITQYTNITMLARGVRSIKAGNPPLADEWQHCTERIWDFINTRTDDDYHSWVSVRSWRLLACLHCHRAGFSYWGDTTAEVDWLLKTFQDDIGFWQKTGASSAPYRGIIQSAQPVIALAEFVELFPAHTLARQAQQVLEKMVSVYALPMSETNPYGFIPFGCYTDQEKTEGEVYREAPNGLFYRYCTPVNHPQQINIGLAGHWMTWAYALALTGQVLNMPQAVSLAWRQIYWLIGFNDQDVSFISGVGYNNPMPHSRFLGTVIGGIMNGFRGTKEDIPYVDMKRECEWKSTEYWNIALAYCLLALSRLLPSEIPPSGKLGTA